MVEKIGARGCVEPIEQPPGRGYWHAHLPIRRSFIHSVGLPWSVRRLCIQSLLDAALQLQLAQVSRGTSCRVVAAIDLPSLADSQLIVFFGDEQLFRFFQRQSPDQTWVALPRHRSLEREWKLRRPKGFLEWGFEETLDEDGMPQVSEVWFFGNVATAPNIGLQPTARSGKVQECAAAEAGRRPDSSDLQAQDQPQARTDIR